MTSETASRRPVAAPAAAVVAAASRIELRVTDAMVARFAALTGDRSSLHLSEDFARRSPYRRPVVHGMLPVGFLALLGPFRTEGFRCEPVAMSGRFVAPVYAGDRLVLDAGPGRIAGDGREAAYDFRIANAASGQIATEGEITVAWHPEAAVPSPEPRDGDGDGGMLLHHLDPSDLALEQIERGTSDRLEFRISDATQRAFIELLADGVGTNESETVAGVRVRCHVPNLLALLLLSTSVGVSLPGVSATFLEFSARFERGTELDALHVLDGEVVHRSLGTRIVKKTILIHRPDRPGELVARGRVAALVGAPARPMPGMEALRSAATDWGLRGRVVLITGASRGIGETTAKLFALHGASVIVNYRRGAADAARVVEEIRSVGGDAEAVAADVADADEVGELVRRAIERYGAIDILVNNAVRDYRPIPFAQLTWEEVQLDMDVIAKGAFLCCRRVIPHMLERGGGRIINLSSVAADDPPPSQTKYVMAKSALVGLTRSLAAEYASRNIQVNMVVPNFVETDLVAHVQEGFRQRIAEDTPMGRHATPIEVAQAVVFLASSHSSFTTGQKLMVTGGGAPYL